MPNLKYWYCALYILLNCFFKQVVNIFLKHCLPSRVIYINCSVISVTIVAGWLDGSLETRSRLLTAQRGFDNRKSQNIYNTF